MNRASQVALMVKNPPGNAGDAGSIPRLRTSPGEEYGNPLQYSCLGNPMAPGKLQSGGHELVETEYTHARAWIENDILAILYHLIPTTSLWGNNNNS